MAEATESQLTISCLQCEWSVERVNTPAEVSTAFLEAAHSHVDEHEQHARDRPAAEIVQRELRRARAIQPRHERSCSQA